MDSKEKEILRDIPSSPQDSFDSRLFDNLPYNLYMYWWDERLQVTYGSDLSIPFSHSGSIFSIVYSPWLSADDFKLIRIPYDTERFKYKDNGSQVGINNETQPYVFRIKSFNHPLTPTLDVKVLGKINPYPNKDLTKNMPITNRHWSREGKLHIYPYTYHILNDGLMDPVELKPQEFRVLRDGKTTISVHSYLNVTGDYQYVIEGYNGNIDGQIEGFMNTKSKEIPTNSNQYAQWIATNKHQQEQNIFGSIFSNAVSVGGLGATASGGNPYAIGVGAILGAGKGLMSGTAQEKDMRNMPGAMKSVGNSELVSGLGKYGRTLSVFTYKQTEEFLNKYENIFYLYGYAQNKILNLNTILKSRYYFNYVKVNGIATKPKKGVNISKNCLTEINNVFLNGATFWHVERNDSLFGKVEMFNYDKDNIEINKLKGVI